MTVLASYKRRQRQITHIFTECKRPPVLLPYFTGMVCGSEFVFVFAHNYHFKPVPEGLSLEATLGRDESTYSDINPVKVVFLVRHCNANSSLSSPLIRMRSYLKWAMIALGQLFLWTMMVLLGLLRHLNTLITINFPLGAFVFFLACSGGCDARPGPENGP